MDISVRKAPQSRPFLVAGIAGVGLAILLLSYKVFMPLITTPSVPESSEQKAVLAAYNYAPWHSWAVQGGRTKPFESAAIEVVRQVTTRSKFEGKDPVAIVLAWMMLEGKPHEGATDWENYTFIRCDHHGLRQQIYQHLVDDGKQAELTNEQLYGKHVSPADLRQSPAFEELLKSAAKLRQEDPEKAHFNMSQEQLKADDVGKRLVMYDAICGRLSSRLYKNALVNHSYFDLEERSAEQNLKPEEVLASWEQKLRKNPDPFHIVALDHVPDSGWFSLGEIREAQKESNKWRGFMEERLAESPQLYMSPDRLQKLVEFQQQIKKGQGQAGLDELRAVLKERRDDKLQRWDKARKDNNVEEQSRLFSQIVKTTKDRSRIQKVAEKENDSEAARAAMDRELKAILEDGDNDVLKRMQQALDMAARTKKYHPGDPAYRMLHLDYLESLDPDIYHESITAQPFPRVEADRVLAAFANLKKAYRSNDAEQFDQASQAYFLTLRQISDQTLVDGLAERHEKELKPAHEKVQQARKSENAEQITEVNDEFFKTAQQAGIEVNRYPGNKTLPIELTFNRAEPFMWAWIIMLLAIIALVASMVLKSRIWYGLGFALYLGSLAVQGFGFFCRIYISGRAPVTNMYETVIFVACMTAVFALVLEAFFRSKIIALTGALVATLALVLADMMPVALDPKISPLVPVLRSNYWLTIHVLVIVSSYAAGSLAWGLGNLSLAMLAFGKGRPDTVKTLASYTYRAIQIAVLLLAAGTFLGGWWAAVSWGRFWGWDSKEVGALIALVCYVIPLHMRYFGLVKDFGLAVSAVLCYAFIIYSWYAVNFVIAAGLHSYGFGGGGGPWWVLWVSLLNVEWVLVASYLYLTKAPAQHDADDMIELGTT